MEKTDARAQICGYYYNWQAAMQEANAYYNGSFAATYPHQGICPDGWHIPTGGTIASTTNEFSRLASCVNSPTNDCLPQITANLTTGTAFNFYQPGGNWKSLFSGYSGATGTLYNQGTNGRWWSSTQTSATNAYTLYMNSTTVNPASSNSGKFLGFSVRCVKD